MEAYTVAIDPGIATGIAVFNGALLTHASVIRNDYATLYHFLDHLQRTGGKPLRGGLIVCEFPVVYSAAKSKGDPNNLLGLAVQYGHCEAVANWFGCHCRKVQPREWKGQTPKDISKQRTVSALTKDELAAVLNYSYPVSVDHNRFDAIGIGLWSLRKRKMRL